jgi:hypothetical protein
MAGPTQLLVINAKDPRLSMDLMDFPGAALELLIVAPLLRIIAASISMEESVAAAAAVSDMD